MKRILASQIDLLRHSARFSALARRTRLILLPPIAPTSSLAEPRIEPWIRLGGFVLFGLFGGFLLWAAFAPISSAALGSGSVKVETNRKIVQHLEGGILRDIVVREGQRVKKDDTLFRLDSVDADADRQVLQGQYDLLLAKEMRLTAQREGRIFDPESARDSDRPRLREALMAQGRIYNEQAESLDKQIEVWRRRKDQFNAQIDAARIHMSSLEAQRPLLEEELRDAKSLLARGYGLKPRVLGLERQVEAMRGDLATDSGKISSLREQAAEVDAQIQTLTSAQARQIAEDMQDVQSKKADIEESLKKSVAKQGRREVTAPVDGIAMNIRSFTVGGIVAAGGALVDIVPAGEKLLVDARLQPTDIDVVRPDLQANVRFIAYKQRTTPVVNGRVVRISADSMTDEKTGASFYTATVEVTAEELARVPHVKMYPGMPVEVAIVTGQRTLLSYLLQPFTDSMARSFRED